MSALVGVPDPSLAWDVLVARREEERMREIRHALTEFNLAVASSSRDKTSFAEIIGHLRSPAEIQKQREAEERAESDRILAFFQSMQSQTKGVRISQIQS